MNSSIPSILRLAYMTKISNEKYIVDCLSYKEKYLLINYSLLIERYLEIKDNLNENELNLITENGKLNILSLGRENPPSHSLVMVMLLLLKPIVPLNLMKYDSIERFLNVYSDFNIRPENEKNFLFETANWMNILFKFIPAKVNSRHLID